MINATIKISIYSGELKSHKLMVLMVFHVCSFKIQSLIYTSLEYYVLANDSSIYIKLFEF